VRDVFFAELVKELLGPRKGPTEPMDKDPRNEYVTGILEPKDYDRGLIENYSNADIGMIMPEEKNEEDDSEDTSDFETVPSNLDPRALPKSMGISFVVYSENRPVIDFCATWARYHIKNNVWHRKPDRFVERNTDITQPRAKPWSPSPGVQILLRAIKQSERAWHVSIFMINTTKMKGNYPDTSELIFQPQIRVHFQEGVMPLPVDRRRFSPDEKGQLELLYDKLQCLARGHMCGATWQQIDPERPFGNKTGESPFLPEDIKQLAPDERKLFDNPSVRTEFLPSYTVTQSTVEMHDISGMKKDDTDAFLLSSTWDFERLSQPLKSIADEYEKWIRQQRTYVAKLETASRKIAETNLDKCDISLRRIREGIELLRKEDVRLAFCFMNHAMNIQANWNRSQNLIWRPFQLAFILQCIPSLESKTHGDRGTCDLLWYPTGGGKTEAYLGLMIFTLALRRLRNKSPFAGGGTAVLSRYTLRLLTIQQFRRTLAVVTACEYLRMQNWTPSAMKTGEKNVWGRHRFSIGLWVGGNVTPNNLVERSGWDNKLKFNRRYIGAVGILKYAHKMPAGIREQVIYQGEEPAQVLKCPSCSTVLAVPSIGLPGKEHEIYWIVRATGKPAANTAKLDYKQFRVRELNVKDLPNPGFYVVHVKFSISSDKLGDDALNEWWRSHIEKNLQCKLECSAPSRPGYFIRHAPDVYRRPVDFEIHCPNPNCKLNELNWWETAPAVEGQTPCTPLDAFAVPTDRTFSHGIPIPAYTTDAQIYSRCPSIVIATVDKFARLPFEPRASAIFGNVNRYDSVWGYHRDVSPPDTGKAKLGKITTVNQFEPPELIVQDELHLIEGPLGSMVGLYETAIDILATRWLDGTSIMPKYIASTATTKQASTQVRSLFNRDLHQFPAPGLTSLDNFFARGEEGHPLDDRAGRLYVGVCCPGKGPQTPTVRIWSSLLQEAERVKKSGTGKIEGQLLYYWTLVGYFNAIRELAAARALYRVDIPEWMRRMVGAANARSIDDINLLELHSNVGSAEVSAVLERLEKETSIDAVMATSMFGTGVDIDRLSLMIVHGQPKTTASYIQATGRVGRKKAGLVVTFLKSTRPRDLDHYEFFTGYHRALHKYVEPVTVAPFSPRACDHALGPVAVAVLRNGASVEATRIDPSWAPESGYWKPTSSQSGSRLMKTGRSAPELRIIAEIFESRAGKQPSGRKRAPNATENDVESFYEKWENVAKMEPSLLYSEPSFNYVPSNAVVLGDEQHLQHKKRVVAENTPQSMREMESTTRFRG
jgi:hypothetical protein